MDIVEAFISYPITIYSQNLMVAQLIFVVI